MQCVILLCNILSMQWPEILFYCVTINDCAIIVCKCDIFYWYTVLIQSVFCVMIPILYVMSVNAIITMSLYITYYYSPV